MESEKSTEQFLREQVELLGGEAYKFVSPNRRFVLDRICVLPHGVTWFVEVKSEGQKPTQGQYREIIRLMNKGHRACWVQSKLDVRYVIEYMRYDVQYTRTPHRWNQEAEIYIQKLYNEAEKETTT